MNRYFTELLNAYWLRPETALWRACDIRAMSDFSFGSPSLDLGCGDGVFSFIRAGGRLSPAFDVFQNVAQVDRFFEKADVYDAFDASFRAEVVTRPEYRIDVGLDHKANLLSKAKGLGLYAELKEADANRPLPFADGTFRAVFSNVIYWLEDPLRALSEVRRVLAPGGQACVLLPNSTLRDFSFYWALHKKNGDPTFAFLDLLDRGRLTENIRQVKSKSEWLSIVARSGLRVVDHRQYLSRPIVQIWDVGLRPLFPALTKMVSHVPADKRPEVKKAWMDSLAPLLAPLVDMDPDLDKSAEPAFHRFILAK